MHGHTDVKLYQYFARKIINCTSSEVQNMWAHFAHFLALIYLLMPLHFYVRAREDDVIYLLL